MLFHWFKKCFIFYYLPFKAWSISLDELKDNVCVVIMYQQTYAIKLTLNHIKNTQRATQLPWMTYDFITMNTVSVVSVGLELRYISSVFWVNKNDNVLH